MTFELTQKICRGRMKSRAVVYRQKFAPKL